jgi:hypothetical protein
MHRELLWSSIVESSGQMPARYRAPWKVIFFASLFGALVFCKYAHGQPSATAAPPAPLAP